MRDIFGSNAPTYRGYEYDPTGKGMYGAPCGSVLIHQDQKGYKYPKSYCDSNIECYGGITLDHRYGSNLKNKNFHDRIIGFDTLSKGNYIPRLAEHLKKHPQSLDPTTKKLIKAHPEMKALTGWHAFDKSQHHWTETEIADECKKIIDQLIKGNY